ncbi:N-alpha-acetyltransferase 25, NatB auxiliary subunit-like [Varroa jacobsoni]|uniref:N-terminal acetyltransferase B complex subunit MDM20 homolog n=1 Tax=Varroa destructor TaxID=109461 RepID=A0A7M7MGN9_VARDE|nr:N-alpha-acetyltransferase 25, NatB auxiliary subunit-like [Varroa destructor]XP_022660619.1 N-alpha-acetyltransferase 25, NatB auxiliary subunit-like [Varroa destructor]XP_022660620.1 N-alpha-acetyltransferase 25, NatB auxiliary subunit-like [Varroa destructor]XP_022660621.1 N-alpha-acetyltransferase 25, NatB auxiliary subunit-like [Varroa destructor]XP_022709650.1 N-alpha-acetyltransferase 25, NatB auxiliary subunit-like [Varroa jacobsoni]
MPPKKEEQRALLEERRLRTVYDFFDNSDYKRALQDCDKVIKKYGNKMGPTVYALKALALTKLYRWQDANKLMDELIKKQPTEDSALSPLVIALRDAERHTEVIPLYESACKRAPNEEILNSLFMLYIREKERAKAKNTALQLHKLTDKRTYYFTAVMHQYLSGKESEDQRQRTMCFTLADKMLERMPPSVDAEINLQYMILRDSERLGETAEFLEKNASRLYMLDIPEEKWLLYNRMQDWDRAVDISEASFARRNCEDHKWLQRRFDIGEKRGEAIGNIAEKLISLIEKVENHDKRRELLINRMLLYKRLGKFDEFEKTFINFYKLFENKTWCVADILFLVRELPEDQRTHLVNTMSEVANKDSLTWMAIDFDLGQSRSDEEELKKIKMLCDKYRSGAPLERQSDANPMDGYLELAVDMVAERFKRCGDERSLLKIIDELEFAKERSPNGFRLKMRLMWCYCAIQAGLKVLATCDNLTIKYLQWESLGYLISPYVLRCSFGATIRLYRKIIALHASSQKDIGEGIVSCYKFGSFHKVEEMEELKPWLENSFELANAKVMRALLACSIEKLHADERTGAKLEGFLVPTVAWDRLQDNRDTSVLPKQYHFIFTDFETKKQELKLRYLVLRLLTAKDEKESTEALKTLRKVLSPKANVAPMEDLSNAFEYYIAPLTILDCWADGSELKERVNTITSIKLESLRNLGRFVVCAFEWVLALSCMTVFAAQSKNATAKKILLEEVVRTQQLPFAVDGVFTSDTGTCPVLRDDFGASWSISLVVLKGAEKLLRC